MNILVIPTTDWLRHPVPNRLNFIFDSLAERNNVFVLHFPLKQFRNNTPRPTNCILVRSGAVPASDPSLYYLLNAPFHLITLEKLIKKEKIDVILSANILPSFIANMVQKPIVFDYLDHLEESASVYYPDSMTGSLIQKGVRVLTRFNLRHSKAVITGTNELKEYLSQTGGKELDKAARNIRLIKDSTFAFQTLRGRRLRRSVCQEVFRPLLSL